MLAMPREFVKRADSVYQLGNVTIRATILVPVCLLSVQVPASILMVPQLAMAMGDSEPRPSSEQIPALEVLLVLF